MKDISGGLLQSVPKPPPALSSAPSSYILLIYCNCIPAPRYAARRGFVPRNRWSLGTWDMKTALKEDTGSCTGRRHLEEVSGTLRGLTTGARIHNKKIN